LAEEWRNQPRTTFPSSEQGDKKEDIGMRKKDAYLPYLIVVVEGTKSLIVAFPLPPLRGRRAAPAKPNWRKKL